MMDKMSQGGCNTHGPYEICGHTTLTCPNAFEVVAPEVVAPQATQEKQEVDTSIVRYFQDLGKEECGRRLAQMSENGTQRLINFIKKGDVINVVNLMEMFRPDVTDEAELAVPTNIKDTKAWEKYTSASLSETMKRFGTALRYGAKGPTNTSENYNKLFELVGLSSDSMSTGEIPNGSSAKVIDVPYTIETKPDTKPENSSLSQRVSQMPEGDAKKFFQSAIESPATMRMIYGDKVDHFTQKTDAELLADYELLLGEIKEKGREDLLPKK